MCDTKMVPDTQPCMQAGNTGAVPRCSPSSTATSRASTRQADTPTSSITARRSRPRSASRPARMGRGFSFAKRYCVPNSSGPAKQNDSTARCWGIAQANLDANGRPAAQQHAPAARLCDCQFTDWSHDDATAATRPRLRRIDRTARSTASPTSAARNGHPVYRGQAPVVTSATTFGQWWNDGTWESDSNDRRQARHRIRSSSAPVTGATNLYRFSSAPHAVWGGFFPLDPAANNFPIYTTTGSSTGPGATRTTPAAWSEPLLCNLWPYWYSSTSFGAGNGCKGRPVRFRAQLRPPITSDPAAWFGMHISGGLDRRTRRGGSTTRGSRSRRATCSRSTVRSICSSSATTTRSCSSTACW